MKFYKKDNFFYTLQSNSKTINGLGETIECKMLEHVLSKHKDKTIMSLAYL